MHEHVGTEPSVASSWGRYETHEPPPRKTRAAANEQQKDVEGRRRHAREPKMTRRAGRGDPACPTSDGWQGEDRPC
jgi:hypothetical protein